MRPSLLLALAAAASACNSARWRREIVSSEAPVAIYLERQVRGGQPVPQGFAHPAQVPPPVLTAFLGSIRHRPSAIFGSKDWSPVLTPKEMQALGGPLSSALARVSPDERVRFLVGRPPGGPFSAGPKGTSAVVFLRTPGRISIAFDLLDETLWADSSDPRDQNFPKDPVEITGTKAELNSPAGSLVPGTGGRVHPRWVEADLTSLSALAAALPPAAAPPPPAAAQGAAAAPPPAESWRVDKEAQAIEHRLQVLEELRKRGAISQEELERLRRQLLLQSER